MPIVMDSTTMDTLLIPKIMELATFEFSAYRKNSREPKFAMPSAVPNSKVFLSFNLLDLPVTRIIERPITPAIPNAIAEKLELYWLGTAVSCASFTIESVNPIETKSATGRSIAARSLSFLSFFLKVVSTTATIARPMPIILFDVMLS